MTKQQSAAQPETQHREHAAGETVGDVVQAMQTIAPLELAEHWDNVGLLVGDQDQTATRVLLTIDTTPAVLDEAILAGAHLLVSYHPVMFRPVQKLTMGTHAGRLMLKAMRAGLAIYSPHTALDAARGGMTDWLADSVGQGYRRPLKPAELIPATRSVKVVTFVPADALDRVRDALASAGAGLVGQYSLCSFASAGTGTFMGNERSNPAVGKKGRLEKVEEYRLEMVCPASALHVMVATLKQFHPYEEPAFDLYPLKPIPQAEIGAGRRVVLDQAASVATIGERVKKHLGIRSVKSTDPTREVRTVAVVPGSGAALLDEAIEQGCDLFITGEMTYHQALAAWGRGCSIVLAGHADSERGYLRILRERLAAVLGDKVSVTISQQDRSFLQIW